MKQAEVIFVDNIDPSLVGKTILSWTVTDVKDLLKWVKYSDMIISPLTFDSIRRCLEITNDISLNYNVFKQKTYYCFVQEFKDFGDIRHSQIATAIRLVNKNYVSFSKPYIMSSEAKYTQVLARGFGSFKCTTFHEDEQFNLSDNEISLLPTIYDLLAKKIKPICIEREMVDLFNSSFENKHNTLMHAIGNHIKPIINLTVIMEMFLSDSRSEITERLARTLAVFLGRTVEESKGIYKTIKVIYNKRSELVHGNLGKKSMDYYKAEQDAREICRRLILNFLSIQNSIKDIETICRENGFGSNPFSIQY